MTEIPEDVQTLTSEREERRRERDFAAADELRDRVEALGYRIVDTPEGPRPEPIVGGVHRLQPNEVVSVLDEPATAQFSVQWVLQGWPEDVKRGAESFRSYGGGSDLQCVVVDATGEEDPAEWPEGVEVVPLARDFGWATDRNAGLKRAAGSIVVVVDGSVEATGDVFGPLAEALADPTVGIAGPFGITTPDLQHFHESEGPDVDAIEGYLMAFRRDVLGTAGLFDERFKFYRTADIEYSFRVKDTGRSAKVVPLPVTKHEHRMWANTPQPERDKLSKRNFYLFLDRYRGRLDLCVAPEEAKGRNPTD